jgi:hypothetical protein
MKFLVKQFPPLRFLFRFVLRHCHNSRLYDVKLRMTKLKGYRRKQSWCNGDKVKVTPWRAYAGTKGRWRYSSNPLATSALKGGYVVSTVLRPLHSRERPTTHCAGGWGGRAGDGLDSTENLAPTGIRSPDRPVSRYSTGGTTPKFAWREKKTTINLSRYCQWPSCDSNHASTEYTRLQRYCYTNPFGWSLPPSSQAAYSPKHLSFNMLANMLAKQQCVQTLTVP